MLLFILGLVLLTIGIYVSATANRVDENLHPEIRQNRVNERLTTGGILGVLGIGFVAVFLFGPDAMVLVAILGAIVLGRLWGASDTKSDKDRSNRV